jgi:hypothetical protein
LEPKEIAMTEGKPPWPTATSRMKDLERRYKAQSGLADRSQFKIFYCQLNSAPVLHLGVNPAGNPDELESDGVRRKAGGRGPASASRSYFERGEHDVFDCDWPENVKLRELVADILDTDDTGVLRTKLVKTNMAFRRAPAPVRNKIRQFHGMTLEAAMDEAKPFLTKIIEIVQPQLIILGGVKMKDFVTRYCDDCRPLARPELSEGTNQTVYYPATVRLRTGGTELLSAQVAHSSQFGYTYRQYRVAEKIRALMRAA